ncbi:MAG: sodium:calcium antiporter [Dissulfurispiraceae bacterium]|jgi:cation:H+ antiporter|nr:sodium:calcium antiporter [Dissulfurispiraceae bacterium]
MEIFLLVVSLLVILASAEIFTNGVEMLGKKLSLSQAVVGSLLAAVGTALPETILPVVAILLHPGEASHDIGVGAILGAPFMLSTLALLMVGITVFCTFLMKRRKFEVALEVHSMQRDLLFFILMYGTAIFLPMFIKGHRVAIALLLVAGYCFYAYLTFRGESGHITSNEELYLKRIWNFTKNFGKRHSLATAGSHTALGLIVFQVLLALGLMVSGAHMFVGSLQTLAIAWGMNPLLFALLIAPIATELPEKFNSVTWTIKGSDALAMGNLTGAMVFQSTFPVAVGLIFTDWNISGLALFSAVLALGASVIVLVESYIRKKVSPITFMLCGSLFAVYTAVVILG